MSQPEIIEKLNTFLGSHDPLTEECHVVYLMVEVRKILDHEDGGAFPLLRFFCDWTVHTEKDHITSEMKEIMQKVYETAKGDIENPGMRQAMSPIMQFAYMEELYGEMKSFLEQRGMSLPLVEKDKWIQFVQLLVKVLENQPINKPTDDIEFFSFIPAADRCVQGIIKFTQPIKGYPNYKFGNAY